MRIDKILHFLAGIVIAAYATLFIQWWWALVLVAFIGGLKELIYDKWMQKGTPEWWDFIFTIFGGGVWIMTTYYVV